MSRIGKQSIKLPAGVSVIADGRTVKVTGPKGTLSRVIRPELSIEVKENELSVRPAVESRRTFAYWGLTRALLAGMVEGVAMGFSKKLSIEGIGYRAALDGASLVLALGFSHPVRVVPPEGIEFHVEKNMIVVSGVSKELVGDTAARIRAFRPPEPYKGKGIRYLGEIVRRKAGKKAVAAGG